MMPNATRFLALSFLLTLAGCGSSSNSAVTTTPIPAQSPIWVSAWADAPTSLGGPGSSSQTFREIVKPTVGSRGTVRLHFSNYFGTTPVTLGAVHIAVQSSGAAVSSDVAVTFSGSAGTTIAAGGFATSDSVSLNFNYGSILAITEYVSGSWTSLTQHTQGNGIVTSYANASGGGNATADLTGTSFTQTTAETYLLDRVDVYGAYKETIAAFGSSTTDGLYSGVDQHMTYPEQLAAALHAAGHDDIAVANAGIAGNEVLRAATGQSGISRFARDVVALPGVTSVIDYLGANDLRIACVTASTLIAGKQNIVAQAHAAGLKLFLATTAPSTFCGNQNPSGFGSRFAQGSGEEAQRSLINAWDITTQSSTVNGTTAQPPGADAIIDFSAAITDPANTSYMLPAYDSGDDIHPNATGYGVMVKAIPLTLF
jgi:lysophospholipase L1-like esterase